MSKHVASTAEAELSPKVKAGNWTGVALTLLATAAAAGIAAIPKDAWDGLGPWALPVGTFVGALGYGIAAWAKRDPLREVGGSAVAAGGVVPAFPSGAVRAQEAVGEDAEPTPAPVSADEVSSLETTAEADALAARAAELRRGGVL